MTPDSPMLLEWLCDSAVSATGVSCCGVTMTTHGGQSVTAFASSARARTVEDLQHTLGEGPGVAASSSGAAVLVPDLCDLEDRALERWPTFARETVELGVRAVFAFPMLLGSSSVGALSLYRSEPGALTSAAVSHGRAAADAAARSVAEPVGAVGAAGAAGATEEALADTGHADPMQVHQAAGMVTEQLGLSIDEALLRMRAIAYSEGRSVDELAGAIVGRRRRLSKEDL